MRKKQLNGIVKWIIVLLGVIIIIGGLLYNWYDLSRCQTYNSENEMIESLQGVWRRDGPGDVKTYWEIIIDGNKVTSYTVTSDGSKKFETTYSPEWYPQRGKFTDETQKSNYRVDKGGYTISSCVDDSWVYSKVR